MQVLVLPGGGLVFGAVRGSVPDGALVVDLPSALLDADPMEIVYDGKALKRRADVTRWYVDETGQKSARRAAGLQPLSCSWNAPLVRDADGVWRVDAAPAVKAECRRRITAVLKDAATQTNLSGYVSELLARRVLDKGKLTAAEIVDIDVARAARDWVGAMQAACRRLIVDGAPDFEADRHWPTPPAGTADLVARF